MQHTATEDRAQNLEMSLREHLLTQSSAAGSAASSPYPPPPNPEQHPYQATGSTSPPDNLDPNVAREQQLAYNMSGDDGADDGLSPDARKGKRELSTSKRAAQNRAAQRAFRQRKEGYIKKLEEQVKEFQNMEQSFRSLQNENYQLREYILNLQSRLLENQSDIPPPPLHVNLQGSAALAAGSSASDLHQGSVHQLRRELQSQPSASTSGRASSREPARSGSAAHPDDPDARPRQSSYGLEPEYARKHSHARHGSADAKPPT